MKRILHLPHVTVQNANALSSPYTIGFPAMTAWLGMVHALQRKINEYKYEVNFCSVAVVCHKLNLQTSKGEGDYVFSIIGTGNPLDKDGNRPSFIEEARCHLEVSLLIEYKGLSKGEEEVVTDLISHSLHAEIKIAGGDVVSFQKPKFYKIDEGNDIELKRILRLLMPGYAIIERRELMIDAMEKGADAIVALLEYVTVHNSCDQDEDGNALWTSRRKTAGWIVPIATGFHGISELGQAKNQRDPDVPHCFAESIVTLGEFRMPYRIQSLDEIFWSYHVNADSNIYLCQQNNKKILSLNEKGE